MKEAKLPVIVSRLLEPSRYPHPVVRTRLIETHISWVILTGQFAYKLKKPLDLGFLDFSTLQKRRHACEEELRLNARLAPGLYLAVVAISGTPDDPRLTDRGEAIEYAVKMHEFPQDKQLDRVILSAEADPEDLEDQFRDFGRQLALFHCGLPAAGPESRWGKPERVGSDALDNFEALAPFSGDARINTRLQALRSWTEKSLGTLDDLLNARKAGGFVREGHGDLHLRNLVLHGDQVVPFDCLEFSPELRWIDVISDLAFLFMDLVHHRRERLAYAFLNAWLATSGDYPGLRLLWFYAVYRAMVRAKIAGIGLLQHGWPDWTDDAALEELLADLNTHLEHASRLAGQGDLMIIITHGLSGSGKTWLASRLATEMGAIHVRSDIERKRLFGIAQEVRSSEAEKAELYSSTASARTYASLLEIAGGVIAAGLPVVVDATFLEAGFRERFRSLAARLAVPFIILDCQASTETLRKRVAQRDRLRADASEADLKVLEKQLSGLVPLSPQEQPVVLAVQTDAPLDIHAILSRLKSAFSTRGR